MKKQNLSEDDMKSCLCQQHLSTPQCAAPPHIACDATLPCTGMQRENSAKFPEHSAGACGLLAHARTLRDDWTRCAEAITPLVLPIWLKPFL